MNPEDWERYHTGYYGPILEPEDYEYVGSYEFEDSEDNY